MTRLYKLLVGILFSGNLAVTAGVWWTNNATSFDGSTADTLVAIGRLSGLLAFYLILWQLLLIARVNWIERAWGHDTATRLHHYNGIVAVLVLLAHPFLLTIGYADWASTTAAHQLSTFLTHYDDIVGALVGYTLLVAITFISLWFIRRRVRYEVWYGIHLALYVAVLISFGHQLSNGGDFGGWFTAYWQVLLSVTLLQVVVSRFAAPTSSYWRHRFRVSAVTRENRNVVSIEIDGRNMDTLRVRAGQFFILRFLDRKRWWEAHPFSVSRLRDGSSTLRFSAKALGNFTQKIGDIAPGTPVILEGPLGRFTPDRASGRKVLLVAGGIGITPLRTLFQTFAEHRQDVVLLYTARVEDDFVFRGELDRLATATARVRYLTTAGKHLDAVTIRDAAPDVAERAVYVCGPVPMMQRTTELLCELGVRRRDVFSERFMLG